MIIIRDTTQTNDNIKETQILSKDTLIVDSGATHNGHMHYESICCHYCHQADLFIVTGSTSGKVFRYAVTYLVVTFELKKLPLDARARMQELHCPRNTKRTLGSSKCVDTWYTLLFDAACLAWPPCWTEPCVWHSVLTIMSTPSFRKRPRKSNGCK